MSKDNLFLGMARGSVGDVTFSRLNGVQVARARNRAPRNPQSPAQMVQRIVVSTVGKAYAFMSEICDHSFENFEGAQMSQRKFMEVNVALMRDKLADVLAYPVEDVVKSSDITNFSFKNDFSPVFNQYKISAGSLPTIPLITLGEGVDTAFKSTIPFEPGDLTPATITYADIIRLLGLRRGDQLTFIQVTNNGSAPQRDKALMNGFRYARVILEPAGGDLTVPFLTTGGGVNDPNERNEGTFATLSLTTDETHKGLYFRLANVENSGDARDHFIGAAVILSRFNGTKWLRSEQYLELRPTTTGVTPPYMSSTLGLAYETFKITPASDMYLNQAE